MENEINSKLQSLQSETEKAEFLLQCLDFLKESFEDQESDVIQDTSFSVIRKTNKSRRGDIYKKFVQKIHNNAEYIPENDTNSLLCMCRFCGSYDIVILDAEQVCSNCCTHEYTQNVDTIGFKEEQDIDKNIVYSYKRENHFNEWICQFQAKESTTVSNEIIKNIKNELKKQKITHKNDITHTKMKEILKKLGYNKYYEHIPYITTMVNGIKPPTMPQELEDRLRIMFHQIQAPFDKFCPKDRINFLSYSYVLYKFCELLGEDEYLPCFPLLKSKEKLYKHDQIWKKITNELRWQYIPTI
jgi:hypothetical protein